MRKRGLVVACERALVAGARPLRAGTRQQLRAAARRFVRRHRRDAGYLRFVLRSVGASSALAVALLGLGAAPAQAQESYFVPRTGAANPFDALPSWNFTKPALGDLDGDGDLDLVQTSYSGVFHYFENTGNATAPLFVVRTGAASPLDGQDLPFSPYVSDGAPAFGDLDADGDLDLVVGQSDEYGAFAYLENTGSATDPDFARRTGGQNPLDGQQLPLPATPALGDLDGDGDLDLVVGDGGGFFSYLENTGTATSAAFVVRTGGASPVHGWNVAIAGPGYAAPALGDLDGDGDLDLVAGEYFGSFFYFENVGTAVSPAFFWRYTTHNPLHGRILNNFSAPALGDLDGDGDLDLVSGRVQNPVAYFENLAGDLAPTLPGDDPIQGENTGSDPAAALGDLNGDGGLDLVVGNDDGTFRCFRKLAGVVWVPDEFVPLTGAANPLAGQDVGTAAAPALGDVDGDGDLDLVSGLSFGSLRYFENTGSATSAAFVARTGAANPFDGVGAFYSHPALGDLDADGDLDVLVGQSAGTFFYFENTGGPSTPAFILRIGAENPLDGQDVGAYSTPALGDVDGDGDLDLGAGDADGLFAYFENTGSAASAAFVSRTGAANPLDGFDMGTRSVPTLGDVDGDGDPDALMRQLRSSLVMFENAIVEPSLSSFELSGAANPLDGQSVSDAAIPALGDLDADGDLDLVSGEIYGNFFYFENTGSASIPRFAPRTGAANPLDGQNVGDLYSAPSLGDLDGDGDLDLVACRGGNFPSCRYFENTGSATSPAFVPRSGAEDPLDGLLIADNGPEPSLGDLDSDGDLDLVIGTRFSGFDYVENTGTATSPAFVRRTGVQNPLDGLLLLPYLTPALGDVDGDGDLDLFSGIYGGYLEYYENTGTATSPTFVWRTGPANPLYPLNHNYISGPALGDLDGDGDLDVVAVESFTFTGDTFRTFYLPEPGHGLLIGSGIALLAWLDRLRGRRGNR